MLIGQQVSAMQLILAILAAAAAVQASPFPQAVTAAVAPTASAPAGCMLSHASTFGIAVMKAGSGEALATESSDGQPGAASPISDGQPQTGVSQISDGQVLLESCHTHKSHGSWSLDPSGHIDNDGDLSN